MSTTRSLSRPAPATDRVAMLPAGCALILVAHGDRGGEGSNGALHAHAARLSRAAPELAVEVGLLNGSPRLEDVAAKHQHCDRIHVFPLLMSEGYFTDTVIPDRLGRGRCGERFVVHRPLGSLPELTDLVAQEALAGCRCLGHRPEEVTVLLAGHGAKSNTRARLAVEAHACGLRVRGAFSAVRTAYLEEAPFLPDVLESLAGPTVLIGMFASDGLHAGEDLPVAVQQSAGFPVCYTGAIGAHPQVSDIVAGAISGNQSFVCL